MKRFDRFLFRSRLSREKCRDDDRSHTDQPGERERPRMKRQIADAHEHVERGDRRRNCADQHSRQDHAAKQTENGPDRAEDRGLGQEQAPNFVSSHA